MTTTRTFLSLLDSFRDHLAAFDLPEPITVDIDRRPLTGWEHICVHLDVRGLGSVSSDLTAWADTLTDVRATAWRPPAGDSVHLAVHGCTADGTTIRVYSGVPYDSNRFDLQPGERDAITLGTLRCWSMATGAEVAA
jgi:hypothetical protein